MASSISPKAGNTMDRRDFVRAGAAAGAAALSGIATAAEADVPAEKHQFHLKYAPHFGMFKHNAGDDVEDQIQWMVDQGFTALEDNGMKGRTVDAQEKIVRAMRKHHMQMGVFVAYMDFHNPTLSTGRQEDRDKFLQSIRESVEVAKRVNAKWATVVCGTINPRMDWGYQTANVIESLKQASAIFEPEGLVMVLEPLNPRDHPTLFLSRCAQTYQVCKAVDSPACKILYDVYHMQVSEGNLIPNIDRSWNEIAYFQVGDNPGRHEPTTGEINYRNVFHHIHQKGYQGIVGMEHGNSKPGKEGEWAVVHAYAKCDDFES